MNIATTMLTRGASAPSVTAGVAEKYKQWMGALRAARKRRESVISLSALDARALADIGMNRTEITSIVYAGGEDRRRAHEER